MNSAKSIRTLGNLITSIGMNPSGGTVSTLNGHLEDIAAFVVGGRESALQMPIAEQADSAGIHFVVGDYGALVGWLADLAYDTQYVGYWQHDGDWFFDAVDLVEDEADALNLAKERGEIAIWDGVNSQEVLV